LTTYVDTSVIVAAVTREPRTTEVLGWFASQADPHLVISDWTITEVSSALALKLRVRAIDLNERAKALAAFESIVAESLAVVAITPMTFRLAAAFCDRHELGLRAADALHLAAAMEQGAAVCTLDRTMTMAGPLLGVSIRGV